MAEQDAGEQDASDIHVDEDWKKSVAEEKAEQRDREPPAQEPQAEPTDTGPTESGRPLPAPTMESLIAGLYMQTLMSLGEVEDPVSKGRERRLPEAGHLIDTIALLQEKTQGNLTEQESAYIESALYDLRMRYVRVADAPAAPDDSAAPTEDSPAPE